MNRPGPVDELALLAEACRHGSRRALSRLITCVQDGCDSGRIMRAIGPPDGHAMKIGMTGSAGAGKSTLVAALIQHLRQANQRVAVVACDPASPLTGGALLGDRIRMAAAAGDPNVFVRSLSTRGAAGGIAESTGPSVDLLERFGFDVVFVESIGVGQDQVAVRGIVDVLVLVVTPAGGDEIQWQKAGLCEVADIVIVNKADLPGADKAVAGLREVLPSVAVAPAVATTGKGVPEAWRSIEACFARSAGRARAGTQQTSAPALTG